MEDALVADWDLSAAYCAPVADNTNLKRLQDILHRPVVLNAKKRKSTVEDKELNPAAAVGSAVPSSKTPNGKEKQHGQSGEDGEQQQQHARNSEAASLAEPEGNEAKKQGKQKHQKPAKRQQLLTGDAQQEAAPSGSQQQLDDNPAAVELAGSRKRKTNAVDEGAAKEQEKQQGEAGGTDLGTAMKPKRKRNKKQKAEGANGKEGEEQAQTPEQQEQQQQQQPGQQEGTQLPSQGGKQGKVRKASAQQSKEQEEIVKARLKEKWEARQRKLSAGAQPAAGAGETKAPGGEGEQGPASPQKPVLKKRGPPAPGAEASGQAAPDGPHKSQHATEKTPKSKATGRGSAAPAAKAGVSTAEPAAKAAGAAGGKAESAAKAAAAAGGKAEPVGKAGAAAGSKAEPAAKAVAAAGGKAEPAAKAGAAAGRKAEPVAKAAAATGGKAEPAAKAAAAAGGKAEPAAKATASASKAPAAAASSSLIDKMMARLQGGRFRSLNEQLYTQSGADALSMMQGEPELFQHYHEGFQQQTLGWPKLPVDVAIKWLGSLPPSLVCADFGCGDAKLMTSVKQKVHSFDLVSSAPGVIACNMADVPLDSASVDIAIFSLALMGTDYGGFVKEAARVLKPGGWLWIAEVRSRFSGADGKESFKPFLACLSKLGFKLSSQDADNKMFVTWVLKKQQEAKEQAGSIPWPTLKACVYKRR